MKGVIERSIGKRDGFCEIKIDEPESQNSCRDIIPPGFSSQPQSRDIRLAKLPKKKRVSETLIIVIDVMKPKKSAVLNRRFFGRITCK